MAEPDYWTMSKDELRENTLQWVLKTGYPLELQVTRAMRNAGLFTSQHAHYLDRESNDERPCDVHVWRTDEISIDGTKIILEAGVAIECKESRTPWLLLPDLSSSPSDLHDHHYQSLAKSNTLIRCGGVDADARFEALPFLSDLSLYNEGLVDAVATNVVSMGKTDQAYEALCQVTKAAWGFTRERPNEKPVLAIKIPVIVVNAPALYVCTIGEDGATVLSDRSRYPLEWSRKGQSGDPSQLVLVSLADDLDALGKVVADACQRYLDFLRSLALACGPLPFRLPQVHAMRPHFHGHQPWCPAVHHAPEGHGGQCPICVCAQ